MSRGKALCPPTLMPLSPPTSMPRPPDSTSTRASPATCGERTVAPAPVSTAKVYGPAPFTQALTSSPRLPDSRKPTGDGSDDACAALAADETAQESAAARAHRHRQLVAVFLPEGATAALSVVVVDATRCTTSIARSIDHAARRGDFGARDCARAVRLQIARGL